MNAPGGAASGFNIASGTTRVMNILNDKSVIFDGAVTVTGHTVLEGVTSTGATGTGNLVYSASPTLTGTVTVPTPSNSTDAATK